MNIYVPHSLDDYELCHPLEQSDFEKIIVQINGAPRRKDWHPVQMELITEDEGKKLSESDAPWLGTHALIFRPAAVDALRPLLDAAGELLPLSCREAEVSIFNPTHVIDALDVEASSVLRFSDGRIMRVNRYAFKPDRIGNLEIFKIPDLRASPTFVSERVVQTWQSARLRGLGFKKVWSG